MNPKIEALYNAALISKASKLTGDKKKEVETIFNDQLKKAKINNKISDFYEMSFGQFIETNANEAMTTGQVGFGKEFVEQEILDSMLLERIQDSKSLLAYANIKRVTWYKGRILARGKKLRMVWGSENADVPATTSTQLKKAKTADLSWEVKKLILTTFYSDELLEDSVIEIWAYVVSELAAAFDTSMHQVILNGDTTTWDSVNINIIDANTSTLDDWNLTDFIVINNGARKIALTNTATVNAGVLDLKDIRDARKAMGIKWVDPSKIKIVPSHDVYFGLLGLTQAETIEKFGNAATVVNGVITAIDGMEIVPREELGNATATGEISGTPANNTTGQAVLIHTPSMHVIVRRDFTTEAEREVKEQQTSITASTRVDVKFDNTQNNTEASSPVALIHNITL